MTDKEAGNTPDVAALQAENQKLKDRAQTFEAKATHLEKTFSFISDPEAARANLEAYEQLRKEKASSDPKQIDAIVEEKTKEVKTVFGNKITALEGDLTTAQKELKTLRVTNVAMQEAAKHFNADGLPLLQQVIDATTDWVDGKVVIMEGGKPRVSAKDPRQPMGLPEYMEILANQYPSLAKSQATSGGKPTGTTYTNGTTRLTVAEYTRLDATGQRSYMLGLQPAEQKQFLNQLVAGR